MVTNYSMSISAGEGLQFNSHETIEMSKLHWSSVSLYQGEVLPQVRGDEMCGDIDQPLLSHEKLLFASSLLWPEIAFGPLEK